jgi:hypothetical protein
LAEPIFGSDFRVAEPNYCYDQHKLPVWVDGPCATSQYPRLNGIEREGRLSDGLCRISGANPAIDEQFRFVVGGIMRKPYRLLRETGFGNPFTRRSWFGVAASFALSPAAFGRDAAAPPELRRDRETAIRSIPFSKLNEVSQRKVGQVVNSPSIFRSMPVEVVDCHPQLYLCLVRNPELIVSIWSLMGITNVKLERTGPFTFDADDGAGTVSTLELVYGTPRIHIVYATGSYKGPLLGRRLKGSCVLVLRTGYSPTTSQRQYVTNQLEVFLQLDNVGADLLARTLHPLVGKTADHNFAESTQFLGQVNYAAQTRPEKIRNLIARLERVDDDVLAKFTRVTDLAYADAKKLRNPPQRPVARSGPSNPSR